MKRKSKLLNVVSIIIIVFASLGIFSNIVLVAMFGAVEPYVETYNITMPTTGEMVFSFAFSIVQLAAGIMGVMYRSKKSVLIIGALYCLFVFVNIVMSSVSLGFSFTYVFGLILPVLYMWGWYQSE